MDNDNHFDDNDVFAHPFASSSNGNNNDAHEEESEPESDPVPPAPAVPSAHVEPIRPQCDCDISKAIRQQSSLITISNAHKNSESVGSSNSYVVYNIKFNKYEAKRRYSEFESLRNSLTKLYPTVIVPPIPEKHSLTDYATMQPNRVKDDVNMIDKRKRMLQTFLNRVANHPVLRGEDIFHKFLDGNVSWSEILQSVNAKNTSQQIYKSGEPASPTSSTFAASSTSAIPIPSSSYVIKQPDDRFTESEIFTNKFAHHMSSSMDKSQRKVIRRLGDLANDYAELGAVYNGFSLHENGELAAAIEKVGQAVDSSYMTTGKIITSLELEFAETIQEYSQFAQIIRQVLKYRHLKHAQVELIADTLETKKASLEQLEKQEAEAKRLDEAIRRDPGSSSLPSKLNNHNHSEDTHGDEADNADERDPSSQSGPTENAAPNGVHDNPYASLYSSNAAQSKAKGRRWSSPKMNIVSALSHTMQGLLDVDPETTRRNNIGKTRDTIAQLEEALNVTSKDLVVISSAIQADLDRFQQQKIKDLRDLFIAYARIHVKWCQMNLGTWQEAKMEVEKIGLPGYL